MSKVLMVIFGAGASHDCHNKDITSTKVRSTVRSNFQPPLTFQLFEHRFSQILHKYPRISGAVTRARYGICSQKGFNIEQFFKQLEEEDDVSKLQALYLRYYLQNLTSHVSKNYLDGGEGSFSTYHFFVDQIRFSSANQIIFINMNYDLLLDYALKSIFGIKLASFDDYKFGKYSYLKPHGSCDWIYEVSIEDFVIPQEFKQDWFDFIFRQKIDIFKNLSPNQITKGLIDDRGVQYAASFKNQNTLSFKFPALVAPIEGKNGFILPPVLDSVQRLIEAAEGINIISVGYSFRDKDLNELLQKCSNKFHHALIIDTDTSEDFRKRVENLGIPTEYTSRQEGFSKVADAPKKFIEVCSA